MLRREQNDWRSFFAAIVLGVVSGINDGLTSHAERRQF